MRSTIVDTDSGWDKKTAQWITNTLLGLVMFKKQYEYEHNSYDTYFVVTDAIYEHLVNNDDLFMKLLAKSRINTIHVNVYIQIPTEYCSVNNCKICLNNEHFVTATIYSKERTCGTDLESKKLKPFRISTIEKGLSNELTECRHHGVRRPAYSALVPGVVLFSPGE